MYACNKTNKLKLNMDDQTYNTVQYLTSITELKPLVQGNTLSNNQFAVSLKVMYSSHFL